ncbi:MAG: Gfo/Idh/MocA family oxidoreductase [Clostridiales bacterium]|nr:Gfo/Idh/MocA family oxidoreductase [Clostridiales bacterium]
MDASNGMTYAPKGKPAPVVKPGEFIFSCAHLDHGHIYGMANALLEAGGTLKYVYDPDPNKVANFVKTYPQVQVALTEEQVLADKDTHMVCGAHITSERGPFGLRVLGAGKDYFTDKAPFTTMAQLNAAREMVKATGRKYMCYYGERIHCQAATLAGQMIAAGEIGEVVHVEGFGPHRLMPHARPAWFFEREKYGGILCDIGSHQIEQYMYFTGEEEAEVTYSRIANYANPDHPELEDFGDCNIVGQKGTTNYFRVDWFTPDGLRTWGDGRTLIIGTKGYIELRKYVNITTDMEGGDHVFLVNQQQEKYYNADGVGCPFFGELILDSLNRTEIAMTQHHCFKAAELCLTAQEKAVRLR